MSDDEWEGIARQGFFTQYTDIIADLIAKYHFRRLASSSATAQRKALAVGFSEEIEHQISLNHISKELFDRIDRITNWEPWVEERVEL